MSNKLPTKRTILNLERQYSKQMVEWKKGDTLVSFFRRHGSDSMADAFQEDYERLGLNLNKSNL